MSKLLSSTDACEANGTIRVWYDLICWLDSVSPGKIQTYSGINQSDGKLSRVVKTFLARPSVSHSNVAKSWLVRWNACGLTFLELDPAQPLGRNWYWRVWERGGKQVGGGSASGLWPRQLQNFLLDQTRLHVSVCRGARKTKSAIIRALPPRIDGPPESSSSLTRPSTLAATRSVCQVSATWSPLASYGTFFLFFVFFTPAPPHPDRVATRCETRSRNVFSTNTMYV